MSAPEVLKVAADGGPLGGWIQGTGPPVLLLHGGPGLNHTYLDSLGAELDTEFQVASYQQRGLEPSTLEGPFTVAQSIEDAVAVLDGLGWPRAWVVGHSWGGHLALRLAAERPERLLGALAVDPIGVVGDGGHAAFEAEMSARTPLARRRRAEELDERELSGEGTTPSFARPWRSGGRPTSQTPSRSRRCRRCAPPYRPTRGSRQRCSTAWTGSRRSWPPASASTRYSRAEPARSRGARRREPRSSCPRERR